MEFSKRKIAQIKGNGGYYIIRSKEIRRKLKQIRDCFYITENYSCEEIKLCDFNIVEGDYKVGIKYIHKDEVYYMFLGGTCFYEVPDMIAMGKMVNDKIYLICEKYPNIRRYLKFLVISENGEEINTEYSHFILSPESDLIKELKNEDVKCLANAYGAIKVFDDLAKRIRKKKKSK